MLVMRYFHPGNVIGVYLRPLPGQAVGNGLEGRWHGVRVRREEASIYTAATSRQGCVNASSPWRMLCLPEKMQGIKSGSANNKYFLHDVCPLCQVIVSIACLIIVYPLL